MLTPVIENMFRDLFDSSKIKNLKYINQYPSVNEKKFLKASNEELWEYYGDSFIQLGKSCFNMDKGACKKVSDIFDLDDYIFCGWKNDEWDNTEFFYCICKKMEYDKDEFFEKVDKIKEKIQKELDNIKNRKLTEKQIREEKERKDYEKLKKKFGDA